MSRSRIRSRALALVTVVAASLLLSACNAIPSSGPVQVGAQDLQQAEQPVQFNAAGPATGSSQEDVVRGFVLAAVSSADDYATAREFLSPEYAKQWDPASNVLIDDGSRPFTANDDGSGTLEISALAKVDGEGFMLPVEPGANTELRFELDRVGGEWRISSAPNGIILDTTTFTAIWAPHQLYFVGPGAIMVPETRWFMTRSALPTEIVSALLAGPGERMSGVLHSGFPTGTTLVMNSVPIENGRAQIDLSGNLLEAGPTAMAEVAQQLRLSLQTVQSVNGYDLSAEGTQIRPSGRADSAEPRLINEITDPAVLVGDQFSSIVAGQFVEMPGFASLSDYDPSAITLNPDETAAAIRNAQGVTRVDALGVVPIDERQGLLEPMFDAFDYIWTVQASAPQTLRVAARDGAVAEIAAPWLAGRSPVAVRLSPDGTRIAALVPDEQGSQVLVAGVERDANGVPISTTDDADVQLWTTGSPVDLDWVGQTRFAVLSKADATSRVTIGGVGLLPAEQGSVQGGVQLAGGSARSQLRVLSSKGDLYASQGSGWQRATTGIELLAKHG
ncbi:LpqB family beta-propeller domain-containing protein [Leucobacter sp. NPDC077196]|uniref:LpqB family beta-propeller domain-containing protein n=1 Tax=Leucobacter sp. NPDC077196 TaxID=3154959 RepID=UPI00342EB7F6